MARVAVRASAGVNPLLAGRDHDARREPLDVPLPRPGQRLVEVVRVEDERSLWRGEQPEVREVGVAAGLDDDVAPRRGRQVEGHDGRRAAIEREGRGGHPSVAQRQQVLEPVRLLGEDDRDGIPARRRARGRHGCFAARAGGPSRPTAARAGTVTHGRGVQASGSGLACRPGGLELVRRCDLRLCGCPSSGRPGARCRHGVDCSRLRSWRIALSVRPAAISFRKACVPGSR